MAVSTNSIIVNQSLSEQIYEVLKREIIEGALKPGERLVINTIATKYGVSSTPIRDALRNLVASGFAVKEGQSGIAVVCLTKKDVDELFDIREVLEGLVVREVTALVDDQYLQELEESFCKAEEGLQRLGKAVPHELDVKFHDSLLALCPNRRLKEQITLVMNTSYRVRRIQYQSKADDLVLLGKSDRILKELKEHQAVLNAMRRKDKLQAEEKMREHIDASKADLFRYVRVPEWE